MTQRLHGVINRVGRAENQLGLEALGPAFVAGFGETRGGVRRQGETEHDAAALERLGGRELALS